MTSTTSRTPGALTWYDLKQVSSRLVGVRCELVDLTSLQRNTALKHRERRSGTAWKTEGWVQCREEFDICIQLYDDKSLSSSSKSFYVEMDILKAAVTSQEGTAGLFYPLFIASVEFLLSLFLINYE